MSDQQPNEPEKRGVDISKFRIEPLTIRLSDGSVITLRHLSGSDEQYLGELLEQDKSDRDFAVSLLHHQLQDPQLTESEVAGWSDQDLQDAAKTFAGMQRGGFGTPISDDEDVYQALRTAARLHWDKRTAEMQKMLHKFSSIYAEQTKAIASIVASMPSSVNSEFMFDSLRRVLNRAVIEAAQSSFGRWRSEDLLVIDSSQLEQAFSAFDRSISHMFATVNLSEIANLAWSTAEAIASINQDIASSISLISEVSDYSSLIPNLPQLIESFHRLEESREGLVALEQAGYGYTEALWDIWSLIELAAIDVKDRPIVITSQMRELVEDRDFEDFLKEIFAKSKILVRRWPIVREGIELHREGRYIASVSILLPQIEGVLGDILVLFDVAVVQGSKFFKRNDDGTQGSELKGLSWKKDLATTKAILDEKQSKFIANVLVPERNGILHGVNTTFGEKDRSVHLVLVLAILSLVLVEEEAKRAGRDNT